MRSSTEIILVLEHHRALHRLNQAKTLAEKEQRAAEAKRAEQALDEYLKGLNDSRVQRVKEADNSREAIPTMCLMRKADNERK